MRDTLPEIPHHNECGIVNLNTSHQVGNHWVCYFKDGKQRIYFDSFGQITQTAYSRETRGGRIYQGIRVCGISPDQRISPSRADHYNDRNYR